jgi:imidazolonepropionase-like amidohydrolase
MDMHLRGTRLPERETVELWTDRGHISLRPVAGAQTLATEGFVLPGLVDAHTHPGAPAPGGPLDEALLREDLLAHRDAGVTAVRAMGASARLPRSITGATDLPRVISTGPWLSTPGLFFPGSGRTVAEADLPDAAVEEAAADGWVKLRGDWIVDDQTHATPHLLPLDVLDATVCQVHDAGGRVAIHALHAETCHRAVLAGVDSIEHGLWLDQDLLPRMAAQGTALTPTHTPWLGQRPAIEEHLRPPARDWFLDGYARLGPLTVAAHAAGVTVLAGTDFRPHGTIGAEVRHLAAGGLPPDVALGAACWTARTFFGLPGLDDGAPADFVVYDRDPLADLSVLDHPAHVVLGGRPVV